MTIRALAIGVLLVGLGIALPSLADAIEVRFPIAVDFVIVQQAVRAELLGGDRPDGSLVWQGGDGCHALRLDDLGLERAGERVRFSARGVGRVGFSFLGFCLFPVAWTGYLDAVATPEVGPDWQLHLRDLSSQLLDRGHQRSAVASRIWDVVKGRVDRRLGSVTLDLRPPAEEARALISSCIGPERAEPVMAALASLRPVATRVEDEGIKVDVVMDVPPQGSELVAPPEPILEPAELARWQAALESFDGFLVFVIKDLGVLAEDPHVRDELFALLFDSRHQLLAALAEEHPSGGDPVRELFLTSWDRLRGLVREAAVRGELGDRALRYVTFLAAGDALTALDTVGPWLGLEISSDGLRRLARVLQPGYVGDPLAYSEAPDPVLRELFHFHEPESPPVPGPPPEPDAWSWVIPRAAYAVETPELAALVQRLDRWVPADDDLDVYRDTVAQLLDHVADRSCNANGVPARFGELYGHLVRAVAWQESCWRQFVRKNGKVKYLLSATGDIGIMQINRRVWRGFFDLEKLKWNIAYNAGAGADILGQLLTRYGAREGERQLENAARATYCAYNGGPGAYQRYRKARVPRTLRAIDAAFLEKYRAMATGKALNYVLCIEDWGARGGRQVSAAPSAGGDARCRISRSSAATAIRSSRHAAIACRPRASRV